LPPATQTGAGTFACHVNGKAFIDKSGGWFNCFYQYVDGKYHFAIKGHVNENIGNINIPWSIGMGSVDLTINENSVLILGRDKRTSNLPHARGNATFSQTRFNTAVGRTDDMQYKGELKITRHFLV